MLHIASSLNLHANRFDVLHDLLQHCFTLQCCTFYLLCLFMLIVLMCHMTCFDSYALQVHVRGHQDQLLGVGELKQYRGIGEV